MQSDADTVNDPLLNIACGPESDPFLEELGQTPPFSLRTIMLLQKIDSPFVRDPAPMVDPATGAAILDDKGKPRFEKTIPTMDETLLSWYVIVNQARPNILQIIRNKEIMENIILEFASKITTTNVGQLVRHINGLMSRANKAAGMIPKPDGEPEKNASGPTA